MQANAPPIREQPTALPSYAEAIGTAPPPANLQAPYNINVAGPYQPSGTPAFGYQTTHLQYPAQTNHNQGPYPPASAASFPPTYITHPYPQYGQSVEDSAHGPTTIHIIRPVPPQQTSCCNGRSGPVLAVVLFIIVIGAILRLLLN